jgi:hypothetical protein
MACPHIDITVATERMLHHRGDVFTSIGLHEASEALLSLALTCHCSDVLHHRFLFDVPTRRTIVLITDVARIGMAQLRLAHEWLQTRDVKELQLVSKHPPQALPQKKNRCSKK